MRVLVSVASRHRSTTEIGTAIARVLEAEGFRVDVIDPELVTSTEPYDGVVLGSGVYAGRWLPSARDLVDREEHRLRERDVWLVSSGPIGEPPKPEAGSPDAVAIHGRIGAIEHRVFEGRLDRSKLGVGERLIVAALRASPGDYRPWDDVMEWARSIAASLTPSSDAGRAPVTSESAVA